MSLRNSPVLVLEPGTAWWQWRPRSRRVLRVTWQQDGQWLLTLATGQTCPANLLPGSWLHGWGARLCWRLEQGGRTSVMFWCWQLPAAQWHAWRLRLSLQARPAGVG